MELNNLIAFFYANNEIVNIPDNLLYWLNLIENRQHITNTIYNDKQNVHNTTIQYSFRNSLENILQDKVLYDFQYIHQHFINNPLLDIKVKNTILEYIDDDTRHSIYMINYKQLFCLVYARILTNNHKDDLFKIMNNEIHDGIGLCFTGRITRLLNILSGFYDDIEIQISNSEQISYIFSSLSRNFSGDTLKTKFIEALQERGYSNDLIQEWTPYI